MATTTYRITWTNGLANVTCYGWHNLDRLLTDLGYRLDANDVRDSVGKRCGTVVVG